MSAYELVIDQVPNITEAEYEAALRLVNRQEQADLLRRMLGLEPIIVEPKPVKVWETRGFCDKHQIAKTVRADGSARCRVCYNTNNRASKARRAAARRAEQEQQ